MNITINTSKNRLKNGTTKKNIFFVTKATRLQDNGTNKNFKRQSSKPNTALKCKKKILTTMLPQNLTTNVMTPVIRIIYNDVITSKMTDK